MKIAHVDELPIESRASSGRTGNYRRRVVMRGEPGTLGNFSLIIYYHDGSFASPRHRHNFDQFRYQLDGMNDFDRNGKMTPGILGYFPEGAYYGPQSGPPHSVAVLQFGGPSGSGYLGVQQHARAADELRKTGAFEKGVYRRNAGVSGKPSQDAYEAVWEHVRQRRLIYPKPQYTGPIMMDSNHVPAVPLDGAPGVKERPLGTFTHCQIRASRFEIDPNAKLRVSGRGVFMVLSGSGTLGAGTYRAETVVYLDDGESAVFEASASSELLLMGLPSQTLMSKEEHEGALEAAE